ncbi:Haloacid dehydrogenase incomplete domain containing protein [Pandoravirus celtis]|uniref:Haloacid dehydrogenase incomplete domain containing protein n=1 Tax=Pandoravirus celtis TaxID=2568002 RepID=A0A4D6EH14_9VIRU|nr:Haloacid dehydrogenase incomplete domain containing protein [Pandoravirus celtis]
MPVHASPAGRMANPPRARRTSFGPVTVAAVGQTTERTLAMLGTRRRRDSLNSLASPSWSALGRPQPPPGSPAWTAGLAPMAPASPSWGLATPTPHHGTSSLLLQQQQQHDPAAFKAAVDAYMTSPTYERFVESLCAEAMRAIEEFLRTVPAGVPVVYVFDVDDTLLSSHPGRRHRFAAHLLSMGVRMPPPFCPRLIPLCASISGCARAACARSSSRAVDRPTRPSPWTTCAGWASTGTTMPSFAQRARPRSTWTPSTLKRHSASASSTPATWCWAP